MEEALPSSEIIIILIIGVLVCISFWIRIFSHRLGLPPVVGYIFLGLILSHFKEMGQFHTEQITEFLLFFGEIGIVILLFRVGVGSHLEKLLEQLREASFLAFANIVISGLTGFCAVYYLLGVSLIPSLFVGAALTATSIGVTVMTWTQAGVLQTTSGKLLVNMAVLDDIVAIGLMGFLFAIVPTLRNEAYEDFLPILFSSTFIIFLKMTLFLIGCFIFSYIMETRVMKYMRKFESISDPVLMTISTGFIISAIAGVFGFSLALGAFFAGISFSRDPKKESLEKSIKPLEDLFTPFFFMGIGLQASLSFLGTDYFIAIVLVISAFAGKIVGTIIPAYLRGFSFAQGSILGVSMVPRAEIAMVIMAGGVQLGAWAVPNSVYSSMVLVSLVSCLATPVILGLLLPSYKKSL